MKRYGLLLLALLCTLLPAWGGAEESAYERADVWIHDSLPLVTIRVTDTGERREDSARGNRLLVSVRAQDGSLSQELAFQSAELPEPERAASLVYMDDVNFDGYQDMLLLTAAGARNVFHAVSLWNKEEGRFNPVEQNDVWDGENKCLSGESEQLELCNYELIPEKRMILSSCADGFRYRTEIAYQLEGDYGLVIQSVADVYDAGEGMIGETVLLYATGIMRCWDEQYPEEWYYGQEGVDAERLASLREVTLGSAAWGGEYMVVVHDWVNLRKQDSKESPSLVRLPVGTPVVRLSDGIGADGGWVRVWVMPGTLEPGDAQTGLTGYVWHSFLEPVSR